MSDLPPGWVKKVSTRTGKIDVGRVFQKFDFLAGKEYYIDPVTKESQWEHPNSTAGKETSHRRAHAANEQVQVLHILVKHTGSRNPKNYKGETITRSKDEARRRLNGSLILTRSRFENFSFFFSSNRNYRRIERRNRFESNVSSNCQRQKRLQFWSTRRFDR